MNKHILDLGECIVAMTITETKEEVRCEISNSRMLMLDEVPKFREWQREILHQYDEDFRPLRLVYKQAGLEFTIVGTPKMSVLMKREKQ
jgi:hypothetical protein